ncbi:hypothetical protein Bca101_005124 [Brassica carinata]
MPSVMETLELSSLIGMPSDGKVAREQLSLLVHEMELADGRKSWSDIAESVIAVELGTLTGSEAEDRVSASLIEEGTGFLFDEHGTNLAVEPGVEGSSLSLTTPLIVPSSSSLVKKIMLETVREYDQMRLANSSQTKESSSETTSSSDSSSYSSSHSDESADGADVASESGNVAGDDRRDDVEIVGVEDDGALGSAGDEQNGTGDVNVDEESEQGEFAGDGDHAAVGDDEMGDQDGVDGRSDFSGERDDFSDEHDSFGGVQSGVSGSLGIAVVGDGSDDGDGGSDRRADVTDILRKIKQESLAASLADSLDAFGDPCVYLKKKKRVKHLENELVRRKEKANLVVRVEFEPKELADIPSFDFTRPLPPVHLTLTVGVEDAAKARGKEENRRREEASRRRVAERAGAASSNTLVVMI